MLADKEGVLHVTGRMVSGEIHLGKYMQVVFYLRTFGDLSFKEVGEVLGKTENWARITFYRGKEKLREAGA